MSKPSPSRRPAPPAGRTAASSRGPSDDGAPSSLYDRLRELIVVGRLAPGTRLVETEIAARFAVSRTPVRAALARLQQEGYAVAPGAAQRTRPVVAPLTRADAREVFLIVGQLEGLAAREACSLPPGERRALAADMASINDEFRRVALEPHPSHPRLVALDERFHARYVEAGAGPRLRALHTAVKPQAERYERIYISLLSHELHVSVAEHEAIVRAIRDGQPAAAERAARTNWQNAAARLSTVIETVGERGSW
jgi:DNA-binding GntR family transcriptional regulator